jgi:dihydropyrimidinase
MQEFELTLHGGRIVAEDRDSTGDIGIRAGRIAAIEPSLPRGRRAIDATGKLLLPGGIDSHCHVEQKSGMGVMGADDWYSASVSAAHGGTTTIIPFAAQHRGQSLARVADDYGALAAAKSVIDYSYHLIVSDPTEQALHVELPQLVRAGITSFKVYMTYDALKLDDSQLLDVFAVAAREGALPMVHAENNDVIAWIARHLIAAGHTRPKYHAVSHDPAAESEATQRAISLAGMLGVPVLIVHVSTQGAVQAIHAARTLGAPVYGETCPHYMLLTADNLDLPGMEGAKYCCSPPPRDAQSQAAIWEALALGSLSTLSSDHAPYRYDASGKLPHGHQTTFKQIANGMPGLELRLPLMYSEGVRKGRLTLAQFVALTSTNHARMYGLYPRKGTLAVGSDADIAIWDPERKVTVRYADLHDNAGYCPYEGRELTGWPVTVISRGDVIVDNGSLHAQRGRGKFIARGTPEPVRGAPAPRPRAEFLRRLFDLNTGGKQ